MDHSLNLAAELVGLNYPVQVSGTSKTVTFSAESILTNTQIYALCYYNDNATYPFQWGFLRSDQTSFSVTFQKSGYVRLFGMLLPSVYATQVNSAGTPFNVIDIGVGDGTGTDFDGVMGARITLSFTPPANSNVVPYRGTPANIFMVTDYLHQQGYLLDIHDSAFGNNANQYQTIAIQVDGDVHNSAMIEQMVWIHLFDNSGNLLGVVDTLNNTIVNNICSINLANGFQMMALIQGQQNPNSSNQFTFAIGDPKDDAVVKIEEA